MDQRIREAIAMLKRYVDTPYQEAARAYLRAQLEIARRL